MAVIRKSPEQLREWLATRDGIAHRDEALRAGFAISVVRAFVRDGWATALRRSWLALPDAREDLRAAALAGGRISCVTLARERGWWMPGDISSLHLHLIPGSASPRSAGAVTHWTRPVVPVGRSLRATVEDALLHVSACLDHDTALVVWEAAARAERLAPSTLRAIRWTSTAATGLAQEVTGLSDSGLETMLVVPLQRQGLRVRQQVVLAGHRVDALVGDRLVVQIDGYRFHSSSAQRTRDIALDAELTLRGYTVLRFSYSQIVYDFPLVERAIRRAAATGRA